MLSDRELQFKLLAYLQAHGRRHKRNTVGRGTQPGNLELELGITFDDDTRARADQSWERLQRAHLTRSDYSALSDPEQWVEITAAGRRALERHALDELDEVLATFKSSFVEVRDAAWAALDRPGGPALSQAANSMCELIDHLLREGAPDAAVMAASWFKPDPSSKSGITRRQRARLIMELRHGAADEDRCHALVAAHDAVSGLKHHSESKTREDGVHGLQFAEECLRQVLIWPNCPAATPVSPPREEHQ